MTRALLEQALEALTHIETCIHGHDELRLETIYAIRAHLAQPQGEPVAMVVDPYDTPGLQWLCQHPPARGVRLYTYPAQLQDPIATEMSDVADRFAHRVAMVLECVLMDRASDKWWDEGMQVIGEYRGAMNAIHERESPTFMGEPVIREDKP